MQLSNIKLILDGIKTGDKNGGPTELAKILSQSLIVCNGFNHADLVKRYCFGRKMELLIQVQPLLGSFKKYQKEFQLKTLLFKYIKN